MHVGLYNLRLFGWKPLFSFVLVALMVGLFPGKSFASGSATEEVDSADQLLKILLDASSRSSEIKGRRGKRKPGKPYPGRTHMERNISYLTQHFTGTHGLKRTKRGFAEAKPGYGIFYVLVQNATKPEKGAVI